MATKTAPKREPASLKKTKAPPNGLGHNDPPDEKALREALELELIGLRFKHSAKDVEIEIARETVKDLMADRKVIREAIERTGMPLALFDEAYRDAKTTRVDLHRKEHLRAIIRSAFGVASAPQGELDLQPAAYDDTFWEAEGYRAGIANLDLDSFDVPPEHVQDFQRGLNQATARNGEGLKQLERPAPEPAAGDDDAEDAALQEAIQG